jgi:alkylation response protein AidB-like acyl-CoA dehydrogenase
VAGLLFPNFRIPDGHGGYSVATATIPKGTSGMEILDDWDALGMRASGSNSVRFSDCFVPQAAAFAQERVEWGKLGTGFIEIALAGNMSLVSCFVGIAEAARNFAVEAVKAQKKGPSGRRLADRIGIQQIVAENGQGGPRTRTTSDTSPWTRPPMKRMPSCASSR